MTMEKTHLVQESNARLITQILEAESCRSIMNSTHKDFFFCQVIVHEDVINNNINNYNTKTLFCEKRGLYNMCHMDFSLTLKVYSVHRDVFTICATWISFLRRGYTDKILIHEAFFTYEDITEP